MRFAKVTLLCLLVLVALADSPMAQGWCNAHVTPSATESVRLPFFCGKPGDTVLLPVILQNDSIVTPFQFLIQFDTNWLSPLLTLDSTCVTLTPDGLNCLQWHYVWYADHLITGRMLRTDTTNGQFGPVIDTINFFTVSLFEGTKNVLACTGLPLGSSLEHQYDSLPPGDDTIFYVKMKVKETMPHLQYSQFSFYQSDIFYLDTINGIPTNVYADGCNTSQMSEAWRQTDGTTSSYQVYPKTTQPYAYYFQADTGCVPPVPIDPTVALTANPTTITTSGTSTLSWTSTASDSVVVSTSLGSRLTGTSQGHVSGSIVWTPTAAGTYVFVARAYGKNGNTVLDDATVIVTGVNPGNGPTLSVSGLQSSYDQGMTVSFDVTGTGTSGSQSITINASGPAGSTFGGGTSVTGFSPVTGTFNWVPNQSGTFTVTFTGSSSSGTTTLNLSIIVNAPKFDRLYSSSKSGNRPVGGRPGKSEIAFPIDLVKLQDVFGVQFDMTYPNDLVRVDSFMTTVRIPDYVVYDNIGSTPGTIRVVTFGLNNEPVIDTNTTAILHAMMTIDSSAVPWTDLVIHLANGRESIDPDPLVGSKEMISDSGLVVVDSVGDVNLDRYIDVADVVNIVSYVIGTHTLVPRQFEVADVIRNDSVNVFDLVADVNMIYGIALAQPAPPTPDQTAVLTVSYNDIAGGSSDVLKVSSKISEEVAGVQLQLNYDPTTVSLGTPRLTQDNADYALNSYDNGQGRLRILLYKFAPYNSGEFMQAGDVELVEIPITAYKSVKADDKTRIRLTEALMSTTVAGALTVEGIDKPLPLTFSLKQNYPNPFNPTTTIKFEVGVSDVGALQQDVSLDVYNVLGQHVSSLAAGKYSAGAYEVVWNATNTDGRRVASGVYLYRLRVGGESMTKKMLFLK